MLYMMRFVEAQGKKIYNVFPLRTDLIPKYIRFDTAAVINLFVTEEYHEKLGTKSSLLKELIQNKDKVWNHFFKAKMKCFTSSEHGAFQFNHMIETDGVACSILHVNKKIAGKFFKPKVTSTEEPSLDDMPAADNQDKLILGIDPGENNMFFASAEIKISAPATDAAPTDNDSPDPMLDASYTLHLRYSKKQRRFESRTKKYVGIRKKINDEALIDGKKPSEWETELSKFNRKSLQVDTFKQYLTKKNEVNCKLLPYYKNFIFQSSSFIIECILIVNI
jgi:hypothetical protein